VDVRFDDDPKDRQFSLESADGKHATDLNGLLEGVFRLDRATAGRLLEAQGSAQGWLRFRAVSEGHRGTGLVRLVPPEGLSVISDIDDTIKVTGITSGERTVLTNTFFRDFVAVPCMAEAYRGLGDDVAFHYVSGGPWQMYGPIADFLFDDSTGFPLGSFHMKSVRTHVFEKGSYEDVWTIITKGAKQATLEQKLTQISTLMERFPGRSFILIGDSGEKDPEVFRQIRDDFPKQVREIIIRVVAQEPVDGSGRLEGMRRILPSENSTGSCGNFASAIAQ